MNSYHKTYKAKDGSILSIVSSPATYGGKDGLFEAAWIIDGEIQEPLGYLTFANVAEILSQHKLENKQTS